MAFGQDGLCFAAVRYADKNREVVKSKYILNFHPQHFSDLKPDLLFKIKRRTWSTSKRSEYCWGVIEGLGASREGAEASRWAFIKNRSSEVRDQITKILKNASVEPQSSAELLSTDDGQHVNRCSKELQEERRRLALKDANAEQGSKMLEKSNVSEASQSSTFQIVRKQGRKHKVSDHEIVHLQKKQMQTQAKEKENEEIEWRKELAKAHSATLNSESFAFGNCRDDQTPYSTSVKSQEKVIEGATSPAQSAVAPSKSQMDSNSEPSPFKAQYKSKPNNSVPPHLVNSTASQLISNKCSECQKLKHRVSILEAQLLLKNGLVEGKKSDASDLAEMRADFTARLELLQSTLNALTADKHAAVTGLASSNSSIDLESCYGKVVIAGKVDLGQNFKCTKYAWKAMNTCHSITDWCLAFLRGTLGEKAMWYRSKPRYTDVHPFPAAFVEVAEEHYNNFIQRRKAEVCEEMRETKQPDQELLDLFEKLMNSEEELMKQLRANLSDRTDSMYRQWVKSQQRIGVILPERVKRPSVVAKKPAAPKRKAPQKLLKLSRPSINKQIKISESVHMPTETFKSGRNFTKVQEIPPTILNTPVRSNSSTTVLNDATDDITVPPVIPNNQAKQKMIPKGIHYSKMRQDSTSSSCSSVSTSSEPVTITSSIENLMFSSDDEAV